MSDEDPSNSSTKMTAAGDIGNEIFENELEPVSKNLENPTDFLQQLLLDKVNDSAKSVVKSSIDFLLSLALLFVHAVNCNVHINGVREDLEGVIDPNAIINEQPNQTFDIVTVDESSKAAGILVNTTSGLRMCAQDHIKKYRLLPYLGGVWFLYVVILAIFVWVHSSCTAKNTKKKVSNLKGMYKCTDRIPIFDSLLEIPTAFRYSPISTIFLWMMFVAACVSLSFMNREFVTLFGEYVDQSSFQLTSGIVGFNFYKFTGDSSQYWVLHATAKEKKAEGEKQGEKHGKDKVDGGNKVVGSFTIVPV